jgi:hypothetical protein
VKAPKTICPPCAVVSDMRPAGIPPMKTFIEPLAMTSGGPTQTAMSPARAAGSPPISTVGHPMDIGPPTWGTTPVTIGHTCKSEILAAGKPPLPPPALDDGLEALAAIDDMVVAEAGVSLSATSACSTAENAASGFWSWMDFKASRGMLLRSVTLSLLSKAASSCLRKTRSAGALAMKQRQLPDASPAYFTDAAAHISSAASESGEA